MKIRRLSASTVLGALAGCVLMNSSWGDPDCSHITHKITGYDRGQLSVKAGCSDLECKENVWYKDGGRGWQRGRDLYNCNDCRVIVEYSGGKYHKCQSPDTHDGVTKRCGTNPRPCKSGTLGESELTAMSWGGQTDNKRGTWKAYSPPPPPPT